MADYIPKQDANFNNWQTNLVTFINESKTVWGIPEAELTELNMRQDKWNETYAIANNKRNRSEADVLAKNEARIDYIIELRSFVKRNLSFNSKISDTERERMGLTVASKIRKKALVPETIPIAVVDFSVRMRHTVHYMDESSTGRKKPVKVYGCEIWSKIGGTPPVNEVELSYQCIDTRTPHTFVYQGEQQGQIVYYWLRWVNTRGEFGPWSATVSAIIA